MSNRNRKRVLLKPKSSTERAIRSRYSAAVTLWRGTHSPDVLRAVAGILVNDQSWGKKFERMRAELLLGASEEFHSADNIRRLGLREFECTCPPGAGHNAPRG